MDFLGHIYLNQCSCMCVGVGLYRKSAPSMVTGVLRPCAIHVKFMFCAVFTKEPQNGFWGKIKREQWEDGAEDNQTREK